MSIKENIACYGNYHNFVKLECESPQVIINITQVLLGAKPVDKDCPTTTNTDNYKEECCRQEIGDCMIPTNSQVANRCFGLRLCEIQTIWALVADACQPKTYPRFTNFMSVQYQCGNHRDKRKFLSFLLYTFITYTAKRIAGISHLQNRQFRFRLFTVGLINKTFIEQKLQYKIYSSGAKYKQKDEYKSC